MRIFNLCHGFADFRIIQQLLRSLPGLFVYFRQITEPKHRHFLALEIRWLEFRKFHEDKAQPFNHFIRMLYLHDFIVMVSVRYIRKENIVHQIERINGLEQFVFVFPASQTDARMLSKH